MLSTALLLALALPLVLASDAVYYVRPTSNSLMPCPATFCPDINSISSFVSQIEGHVQLVLLPGIHELSNDLNVGFQFPSTSRLSVAVSGAGRAMITCQAGVSIKVTVLKRLEVDGVTFTNCGSPDPLTQLARPLEIQLVYSVRITNCSFSIQNVKLINCMETTLQDSLFNNPVSITAISSSFGEMVHRNLSITSCTFKQKLSKLSTGLAIKNLYDVKISNSLFLNTYTFDDNAALHIEQSNASLHAVIFQDNVADHCAAIRVDSSVVNISAVIIRNSRAGAQAAICVIKSVFHVTNSSISNNTAIKGTGGLFSAFSRVILNKVLFSSNTGNDGGSLKLSSSDLQAQNVAFMNNRAKHLGGAVFAESSNVFFQATYFDNNSDPSGRAIVADAKSRILKPGGECSDDSNNFYCKLAKLQTLTLSGECNSYGREKWNEGYKRCVYPDPIHPDIPTIGIGFNLKRPGARGDVEAVGGDYDKVVAGTKCLTDYQIRQLFEKDMSSAVSCAQRFVGNNWPILGVTRQSAIADMAFNMGCTRLSGFQKFKAALQLSPPNYEAAALEMQDSRWCRQVKSRCSRNVACMR